MTEEIRRLKNQVALLLACSRTRLDKARWTSIQSLLQSGVSAPASSTLELAPQLMREHEYLRNIIARVHH